MLLDWRENSALKKPSEKLLIRTEIKFPFYQINSGLQGNYCLINNSCGRADRCGGLQLKSSVNERPIREDQNVVFGLGPKL